MLLDRFFDGTFFTYGIEVMSFADRDQEDRIDPVSKNWNDLELLPHFFKFR